MLTRHSLPSDIKVVFVELNFRKSKWLLRGIYRPPSQTGQYFLNNVDKALDKYSSFENVLLVSNFNAQIEETYLETFLYHHKLVNIDKEPPCY